MRILFSIIIPVYNSEKYLLGSLKSILSQSFPQKNFEIIIINDNSKDSSDIIIKKFKKKFKNIKVIQNKINKKVSYCRNIGIRKARGEYIIFLDSDDELKKNSLRKIKNIVKSNRPEVVLCLEFKSNKFKIRNKKVSKLKNVNSFLSYENKARIYNPNCWNMIIKKNFLKKKKISFKKINIFEDQIFCTSVLFKVSKIKILPGTFYNYIQRPLSLSRNTNYFALKSCMLALVNFLQILKTNKLTKNKIQFIKNRIKFIEFIFKKYILICSLSQLKKLDQIYKNFKGYDTIKKKYLNNKSFLISNCIELRKKIISRVLNYKYEKFSKIFIFGFGIEGRTIFHILRNNNIKVNNFVDSNKNFKNYNYFGKKIINLTELKNELNKNSKALILLSKTLNKSQNIGTNFKNLYFKQRVINL